MRKTVFVVDDQTTELTMVREALDEVYKVFTMTSGEKLFKNLERGLPDLILLDVGMPEMDGYEAIRRLKADERYANIPVIFLTGLDDDASEAKGFALGAADYANKPIARQRMIRRIDTNIALANQIKTLDNTVREKTASLIDLQNGMISIVADLIESRDKITGGHIERTQLYLERLLKATCRAGIYIDITGDWEFSKVISSAQLHDVGKISISDTILNKKGKLTAEEFDTMKLHTVYGEGIIDRISEKTNDHDYLRHARLFAGTHHEKWDGSGYPRGLRGESIPLQGRVMAVADVYDALVSERPYKVAFSHETAVQIIRESAGTQFDPRLVDVFLNIQDEFRDIRHSDAAH